MIIWNLCIVIYLFYLRDWFMQFVCLSPDLITVIFILPIISLSFVSHTYYTISFTSEYVIYHNSVIK